MLEKSLTEWSEISR